MKASSGKMTGGNGFDLGFFKLVVESSPDGVMLVQDGKCVYANQSTIDFFGYPREQLCSRSFIDLVSEKDRELVSSRYEKRLSGEGPPPCYIVHALKADGSTDPVEVNVSPITHDGRPALLSYVRDVSSRQRDIDQGRLMEAQLRQAQKLESLGTLASGVAHEINNPLTGIMNYAEMIENECGDENLSEYARNIRDESNRMATIVRNLLSFARQDPGETDITSIQTIIQATLSLIKSVIAQDGIDVMLRVPDEGPTIEVNPQQLQQVLLNLLLNARDAILAKGAPEEERHIILTLDGVETEDGPIARLSVEDSGTGISPDISDRLFDPFFTTKGRTDGTGLGLSISYGMINDMGGNISFATEFGEWTRFDVTIPVFDAGDVD